MPTWHNHTGNQSSRCASIYAPASTAELRGLVRRAEAEGLSIRAVGAGHAWSDVALTAGVVVDHRHLSGLEELDDGTLRLGVAEGADLIRVLGGTTIHELNELLRRDRRALRQMGGYDGQTIAGVISTSTHGSGLGFPPFSDYVRSVDLVVARGEQLRVEPAQGITAPEAFAAANAGVARLVQDDDVFWSVVCGMGTLGMIASVVLEVGEWFWLREKRVVQKWEDIRDTVTADRVLADHPHYEIFLNPYRNADGSHHALVTERKPCPEPPGGPSPGRGLVHPLTEMESGFPGTWVLLRLLARLWPKRIADGFDGLLEQMRETRHGDDTYTSISYEVFNIGEANRVPAYSMELGFTLRDNRHLDAVERLLDHAETWSRRGVWHTSPISLRFVAPSRAYASMMFDQPTMMVELILIAGTKRGDELLASCETELAGLGARPHWGQINHLTAPQARELYPKWETWLRVAQELDPTGVFHSQFTSELGIP
jgi:L-gulono-1,4-lactone dehydrogenase